jgi:hypothetical protein
MVEAVAIIIGLFGVSIFAAQQSKLTRRLMTGSGAFGP